MLMPNIEKRYNIVYIKLELFRVKQLHFPLETLSAEVIWMHKSIVVHNEYVGQV